MESVQLLLLAPVLVLAGLLYFYDRVRWLRHKQFSHIPSPAEPSMVFGHLRTIGRLLKQAPRAANTDIIFDQCFKASGKPEILLFDLRPVRGVIGVIFSHELNEQLSKPSKGLPYSTRKPQASRGELNPIIGHKSILFAEGEEWKSLRKRYNPGFAPNHLLSLLPQILEKSQIMVSKLDELATSGEEFSLEPLCTDLTFDIIGNVVLDIELRAQAPGEEDEIYRLFRQQIRSYIVDENRLFGFLEMPWAVWARQKRGHRLDAALKRVVREKYAGMRSQLDQPDRVKSRSILALSVSNGEEELTPELLQISTDQVKTFLLAGHDTTSTLLQRIYYALSIHPRALAAVRAELHSVFGTADPTAIAEILLARGDDAYGRMTYTSAVIKEALRLWPPAGTGRFAYPEDNLSLQLRDGRQLDVSGVLLYGMHHTVQRDRNVYGDTADDFIPERWLGDTSTASVDPELAQGSAGGDSGATNTVNEKANGHPPAAPTTAPAAGGAQKKIPASAWRPFERGPRNCIGQELANIEARVIVALTVQRFDFEKMGIGAPRKDPDTGRPFFAAGGDGGVAGRLALESELYSMREITSKPVDRMMMKVGFAAKA